MKHPKDAVSPRDVIADESHGHAQRGSEVMKMSLMRGQCAPLYMTGVMLAMAWALETEASPAQPRHPADPQQATTTRHPISDEFKTLPPRPGGNDKSMQIAQATTGDTGALQQLPERHGDWAESLSCELVLARRDIELLQHLEQEHDRAEWLVQGLDAARREVESQKALAMKAVEEASRLKEAFRLNQAGESGAAELQISLQQERDRSARLERDLAAARRDVETQIALATTAGEETSRLKQAAESGAAELQKTLQQERDRSARLEQNLAAARHDVETQTSLARTAGEETSRLKQAGESGAAELQKTLQQERDRSARLEQDLAAARRDVETQTALATTAGEEASRLKQAGESGAAELQKTLQQERDRSARLEQTLANARHDLEFQAALLAKANEEVSQRSRGAEANAADLRQSMQKERERADTLAQDLSLTRSAIYAYEAQTALLAKASEGASPLNAAEESGATKLQKSLQQERDRTGQLEQALATARRDIDTQTALAAKASGEVTKLTQAVKAAAAEQSRSIQKEHDRAEALAQDLSSARTKIYAYEAQAKASEEAAQLKREQDSNMASSCQSQQQERDRAEQLARDLAKANNDLQAQTERASKASEGALAIKQAKERDSAELRSMLQRERERVQKLETEIASAHPDNGAFVARFPSIAPQFAAAGTILREQPIGALTQQLKSAPVLESRGPDEQVHDQTTGLRDAKEVRVNSDEAAQVARLVARASLLLEQGDIGSARTILEHVIRMGSAQAIFVLAETYDPLTLPSFGTYGTHGDASRARDLYAQAEVRGIKEAKPRLDALGR
ncbi:hypothetical protein [Bradyrhizobium sp. CCBAU 53340]|uniref:hypothetical protein n=1 Tax=Bradyrhizobium sp. CCBAU 53340 TaxID=1325112 RepID=UPI001FEE6D3F|nr:hypothetical protein [Bradyrhizobium sp. CCBAU 53340]